ncbi:cell division suppressor protein YneA [Fictibacillus macauensis ZFHKF-1]|uniref:Cell division suppressor protein YneA n=1 Tax=Fictibacillus macauensis ZFHKF-1 TaxID=1196324 RepID=I8UJ71_9BACL|nr:LysM peptidoglycan-binding domain-containing protein [Fictibacillus macauensis]EIT86883.1 cell division suppressor protein YneA [Fictibacillus macauensis ZFHKF-1]
MKRNSQIFVLLSCMVIGFCLLAYQVHADRSTKYMKITVNKGDSLWGIAKQYQQGKEPRWQFVEWVEKNNGVQAELITPGQQLVIPVKAEGKR